LHIRRETKKIGQKFRSKNWTICCEIVPEFVQDARKTRDCSQKQRVKKISKKGVDIPLKGNGYTKCTEKHERENFSCACCAHCKQDELREKKKTVKVPNPEQEKAKQKRNV